MTSSRRMLITAGPTQEAIDDVRFIGNRSSGRMGIALAEAAKRAGWDVVLLLGPTELGLKASVAVQSFVSAEDLEQLLSNEFPRCDVLVMAAAVSDYRPVRRIDGKIPRSDEGLMLRIEPTPDLVAKCARTRRPNQFVVAFALEDPQHLETRALEKLRRKGVDAIVANPIGTISAESIAPVVFDFSGARIDLECVSAAMSKEKFSELLIAWIDAATRPLAGGGA